MYTFAIDDEVRAIRVVSAGSWSLAEADQYVAEFERHFAEARDRFGEVRVLVDARMAEPHAPFMAKRLAVLGRLFDGPGDRLAVVINSSVKKQQVSREGLPTFGMAFLSMDAAEMWLFAYDQAGAGALSA
jgi:hypothetical protein